jgi:hypothetical protein
MEVVIARVINMNSRKMCGEFTKINGAITSTKLLVDAPVYL